MGVGAGGRGWGGGGVRRGDHTNQWNGPETCYSWRLNASDVFELTGEDVAGCSSGVARYQWLRQKDCDESKSADAHEELEEMEEHLNKRWLPS